MTPHETRRIQSLTKTRSYFPFCNFLFSFLCNFPLSLFIFVSMYLRPFVIVLKQIQRGREKPKGQSNKVGSQETKKKKLSKKESEGDPQREEKKENFLSLLNKKKQRF